MRKMFSRQDIYIFSVLILIKVDLVALSTYFKSKHFKVEICILKEFLGCPSATVRRGARVTSHKKDVDATTDVANPDFKRQHSFNSYTE